MILVTGATGHIGRELTGELAAKGAKFRVLVRDPARAPGGVERVVGDLGEPDTLTPAFDGVDRLFLLMPGIGTDFTRHAVAAAKAAGVRHIVHLSSAHAMGDPMPAMGRWHHDREEIIRASGIPATFLRPGGFMTNALDWLPTLAEGGYVLDPSGPGRFAPVDVADIAAVAALVLTEDGHEGEEYVLTGDELLTLSDEVRILSETIGRDLRVREVATPEEVVRARFPAGAPKALADAIVEGFTQMRAGAAAYRTDTVERLLGRKPRTFADWCARNAGAFSSPRPRQGA
ncbi:NAD(P)H-binding protein [Amycolatopsis acidiphila]|uniref:NAD-dependent epimerase/dehydratase family protein n=1 Tax=Amycolatopsis acidiphila TaxID=715473 RepID=A0A558ADA4_9PSEU|nr:NAD(P)H-binding protein [Amycolatopsis acidiphila]TVT22248.1 NAD-dependent epimerase/dehydratase family protein [Amycolatopsis acidiphila]UIJ58042.1 NAD(P)H-binding protein [Amycolatopsis acidiphila]GHG70450.1 nucleotide-diphosphate-sugar epimerase [Amycolatopsis acidiphila]